MGDSKTLTPKQEAFCKAYLATGSASAAYRAAYNTKGMKNTSIHAKAYELMHNGKITVRLDQLRRRQLQKFDTTVDSLTTQLDEIHCRAVENGKYSAGVRAIMLIARLHGLDRPQAKVKTKREYNAEERTVMLQSLLSRHASTSEKNSGTSL